MSPPEWPFEHRLGANESATLLSHLTNSKLRRSNLRYPCVIKHSAVRLLILVAGAAISTPLAAGIVGSGTPTSCTQGALQAQLAAGGTVTFNCGAGPQTIAITSAMN